MFFNDFYLFQALFGKIKKASSEAFFTIIVKNYCLTNS